MNDPLDKILRSILGDSDEDLFVRFGNAQRLLAKGPNPDAERVLNAIEHEWKARLGQSPAGSYKAERPKEGMLAALGYHVGHAKGVPTPLRQRILKFVMEGQLPMVGSPAYTDEWGEPMSRKRLDKVISTLNLLADPGAQSQRNMERAMIEWSEDLDWVIKTFGDRVR
ncbi:MAG TPA: hypothetical protein VJJ77_01800 [Dongiaceae bacterium]|nr:hypothetical protein [Dongiaceae bacterium]